MQAQDGRFPSGHFGPEVTFSRAQNAGYNLPFSIYKNLVQVYIPIGKRGDGGYYDDMITKLTSAVN
jgi:hypothetical protein